jgi:hypothetical protein
MFDSYVLEWENVAGRAKPFALEHVEFPVNALSRWGEQLRRFCLTFAGIRIFFANWDYYSVSERAVEPLAARGCYVVDASMAKHTTRERAEIFGRRHGWRANDVKLWQGGTDTWLCFINDQRARVLSLPHCVGVDQYSLRSTERRTTRFLAPGANYGERRAVYGFTDLHRRAGMVADRIADKLYAWSHESLSERRLREIRSRYDDAVSNSQCAFVSGGPHSTPVRKYFEIPALGAAPVGHRCEGFDELGFLDGQSFVVAERPEQVRSFLRDADTQTISGVARAAQSLVMSRHSEAARAEQFRRSIEMMGEGRFRGSAWRNGEYVLM